MPLKISLNAKWFFFLLIIGMKIWAECYWISIFDTALINDDDFIGIVFKNYFKKVYAFLHLIILPTSLIVNERTACWREKFHKMCVTPSRWKKWNKIQDRQIRETALNASVSSNIIITVFRRSSSSRLLQIK